MRYLSLTLLVCGLVTPAEAEPSGQPDMPAGLQNAIISTLQAQRNEALDRGASAAAQLIVAQKSLAEAQAQVSALQKQRQDEAEAKAKADTPAQN